MPGGKAAGCSRILLQIKAWVYGAFTETPHPHATAWACSYQSQGHRLLSGKLSCLEGLKIPPP